MTGEVWSEARNNKSGREEKEREREKGLIMDRLKMELMLPLWVNI